MTGSHREEFHRDQGMTWGVFILLLKALVQLALLPPRLVWAALTSGPRRRQMADLIQGPHRGAVPPPGPDPSRPFWNPDDGHPDKNHS